MSPVPHDLLLLTWNVLARCWVYKEWYPSLYDLAADEQSRLKLIIEHIRSQKRRDIIFIQEAQEDRLFLFRENLGEDYFLEFAPSNPSSNPHTYGLLTSIRKKYPYASEIKVTNDLLDVQGGDAIQIVARRHDLLGAKHSASLMAGDFNGMLKVQVEFGGVNYKNAFHHSSVYAHVPAYYSDPKYTGSYANIDHIVYDPTRLEAIAHGKAWDTSDHTLEESLKTFGSDHIYIWATFRCRPQTAS